MFRARTEKQDAVQVEVVVVAARARHGKMAVDHESVAIPAELVIISGGY